MRSYEWALTQYIWGPYKKRRLRQRHAEGRPYEDIGRKWPSPNQGGSSGKPTMLALWLWACRPPELWGSQFLLYKPPSFFRWIQWGNKQKKKFAIEVDEDIDTSVWIFKIKCLNPQLHYFSPIKHNPIWQKKLWAHVNFAGFLR